MIQSIFFIEGNTGDVVLEKHYKGITQRSTVELFWEQVLKAGKRDDVAPILSSAKYHMVNILRGGMYVMATVQGEMPTLLVLEFLHRVYSIFVDYFGEVSPRALTEHFSTAYQVLEEMLDNGIPTLTEPNALSSLVAPPSLAGRLAAFVAGGKSNVSETIGEGAMSIIPWRRSGVKYTQNEIFFDIVEEIDMIVESNGAIIASDVRGSVEVNCRLSGVPDLTLVFNAPAVVEEVAFHPCVRFARWEREQVVSFVPPDGPFTLMSYRTSEKSGTPNAPLYCRPSVVWREGSGRVSFTIGSKPTSRSAAVSGSGGIGSGGPPIDGPAAEDIRLIVTFPRAVKSIDVAADSGNLAIDPRTNEVTWTMRALPRDKAPELTGTAYLAPGAGAPVESLHASLSFAVGGVTVSGLNVRELNLAGAPYKFFKGVKTMMRSGRIQVRT